MPKVATTDVGPFAIVPLWLIEAVSPNALALYALLAAKWADREHNECWPSRKTIAAELGRSVDSIDRATKELEGAGALKVIHRITDEGDFTSNLYRLFVVQQPEEVTANSRPPLRTNAETPSRKSAETPSRTDAALTRTTKNQNHSEPNSSSPSEQERVRQDLLEHGGRASDILYSPSGKTPPLSPPASIATPAVTPATDDTSAEGDSTGRPEIAELCALLSDRIAAHGVKRPNPDQKRWQDATRLMLDRDGYTVEQIRDMIEWVQNDAFWASNILSMPKLRDKFPQLQMKRQARPSRSGASDDMARLRAYREQLEAKERA